MNWKKDMDGSFVVDGKTICYKIPADKASVFGTYEREKTTRAIYYYDENGTIINTYNAYDEFEKLQNISTLMAKEYYLRMIKERTAYGTN